jgi:hypothetical protein
MAMAKRVRRLHLDDSSLAAVNLVLKGPNDWSFWQGVSTILFVTASVTTVCHSMMFASLLVAHATFSSPHELNLCFFFPMFAAAGHLFHQTTSTGRVASQACMCQHIKRVGAESAL